ncbi:MAG TPA: TadE/TadG family type IV pilus assembly protein [Acidobacteriaceae bacterium]|nr:TadE/TadG family type IV pilus assembly protein [Acidobacteriaceae bacterium]
MPWGMGSKSLRSRLRDEQGQSLVEFAITFSILIGFVFAFIEVCLMFYTYCMISECAREGSRYAAVHGSTCQTAALVSCTASAYGINSYVAQLGYPNLASGTMTVSTTFPDGSEAPGNHVKVAVQYAFPITLAFVPRNTWTMSTSSTVTILL